MKFQHNTETVKILKISQKRVTPRAEALNDACKRLHFKDDKTQETKNADLNIIKKLAQYRNEYSVGLKVVNANGQPYWVNSYSLSRFSDKKNVSNLADWITKHIHIGQNVRISYFKTKAGNLLTNIQKPTDMADYTQYMPGILKSATIGTGTEKSH